MPASAVSEAQADGSTACGAVSAGGCSLDLEVEDTASDSINSKFESLMLPVSLGTSLSQVTLQPVTGMRIRRKRIRSSRRGRRRRRMMMMIVIMTVMIMIMIVCTDHNDDYDNDKGDDDEDNNKNNKKNNTCIIIIVIMFIKTFQ